MISPLCHCFCLLVGLSTRHKVFFPPHLDGGLVSAQNRPPLAFGADLDKEDGSRNFVLKRLVSFSTILIDFSGNNVCVLMKQVRHI